MTRLLYIGPWKYLSQFGVKWVVNILLISSPLEPFIESVYFPVVCFSVICLNFN